MTIRTVTVDRAQLEQWLKAFEPLATSAELRGDKFPEGNEIHKMADAGFKAITAIKEALVQPEQEPLAYSPAAVYEGFCNANLGLDSYSKWCRAMLTGLKIEDEQHKEPSKPPTASRSKT